jgi:hypothetical protein
MKKLMSWDTPLTTDELEEMEPMMEKIQALQRRWARNSRASS